MMNITEFLSKAKYAIVIFEEYDIHQRKLIELVPRSWITIDKDDNCFCRYPPLKMAQAYMSKWLKDLRQPDKTWSSHQVEVKFRAATYNQGLTRLNRAFKSARAVSDIEDEYKPEFRSEAVAEEIEVLLSDQPPTPPLLSQKETSASNEKEAEAPTAVEKNGPGDANRLGDTEDPVNLRKRKAERNNSNKTPTKTNNSKKQALSKENKLAKLREEMTERQNIMADYIDVHMQSLQSQITNSKRSVQYDIKKRFNNVNCNEQSKNQDVNGSWKEKIGIKLPITNHDDFLSFDASILTNPEKRDALRTMFGILTDGCLDYIKAIKMIMAEMVAKEVQLLYSGAGRITNNVSKLKFNDTNTYARIEDFIKTKYGEQNHPLKILTTVSQFLSGAKDRDGGRLLR